MTAPYQPGLHRFAVFTAASTLLLLVAGGLVTSNDAGLAVPDWPLSYGSLLPPMVGGILYEHGHRMVATSVGILTIILAVWLARRESRRWVRRLGWLALALVIVQGILGGITVKFFLPRPVSIAHATLAQLFFCSVVSLALFTSRWWQGEVQHAEPAGNSPLRAQAVFTCGGVLVQLILGAAYRHQALGILPHLLWAGVVATLVYRTSAVVRQGYAQIPALRRAAAGLSHLVTMQLVLGGAALWARLATRSDPQPMPVMVWSTVAHLAFGALTFAAAVVLALCLFRVLGPSGAFALDSRPSRAAV